MATKHKCRLRVFPPIRNQFSQRMVNKQTMERTKSTRRQPLRELSNVIPPSSIKPLAKSSLSLAPKFPDEDLNLKKFDNNSKFFAVESTSSDNANNKKRKMKEKDKGKGKENCKSAKEDPNSMPSPQPKTPSALGAGDSVGLDPPTVYHRRHTAEKRKSKGKEIADPLSSSLQMRIADLRGKKNGDDEAGLSKSCPLPHKRKQWKETADMNAFKHELPRDFIDKQRAYFAEVDAFELEEEEASGDELETWNG